ncbi:MAG: 16S rRNA (cytosine(1402)-N(4))-methyltransferase RsmH [Melioribacteraceae bacterium]|nr:16S rRNA (cytosine(1402)-N(4))-methyltransferase RsmH [Melioribacteraceae bacterium]
MNIHIPVLFYECIDNVVSKTNGIYFDGTAGFGGHSGEILKRLDNDGKLLATDKDIEAYKFCKNKFKDDSRFGIFHTGFSNINVISKIEFVDGFDGIIADLGVSSFQLDNTDSGFTFREDSPLDMRMDKSVGITAADVLNTFEADEIANIIYKFGEEKKSRIIAKKIVEYRANKKIKTSGQLKEIIAGIVPEFYLVKSLSRVFQALRIFVNDELSVLEGFLAKSVNLLNSGGRIGIITFHSLEDRIVKDFFRYEALECICPPEFPICTCDKKKNLKLVTRKPIVPTSEELKNNRRARSAKLRVAEKI